jgi:hypothetical protein
MISKELKKGGEPMKRYFRKGCLWLGFLSMLFSFTTFGAPFKAVMTIDAAVEWGNGKAYFFRGSQYSRFDLKANRVDPGYPKSITEWTGLPWTAGIEAAVNWGNGKAYFFKGTQYIRWDIKTDRIDSGYPKSITEWSGLPWTDGIEAVINGGNGKVYFFKGTQYVRWDIQSDRIDPGYPKPINNETWPGLSDLLR